MANHERKTVARHPQCRVELCSCGVYHVSFGAMTVRMTADQVGGVFEALGDALAPAVDTTDGDPPVH